MEKWRSSTPVTVGERKLTWLHLLSSHLTGRKIPHLARNNFSAVTKEKAEMLAEWPPGMHSMWAPGPKWWCSPELLHLFLSIIWWSNRITTFQGGKKRGERSGGIEKRGAGFHVRWALNDSYKGLSEPEHLERKTTHPACVRTSIKETRSMEQFQGQPEMLHRETCL